MRILLRIMILATIFSCVAFSQSEKVSSLEFTDVKVFDGFEAKCDSYNEELVNSQRPLSYKMLSSVKNGTKITAVLEITYLTCSKNIWKINSNNSINYKFKDSVGQIIPENIKFQKEKILIKDKDRKIIDTILIPENSNKPFKVTININTKDAVKDPKTGERFVDLVLSAEKVKKNPADYEVSEVNWGHFRFFLDQDIVKQ